MKLGRYKRMKSDYTKLSRIMFIKGSGTTPGAVISVFLLQALTRGHLADTIVRWIVQGFFMSETQADTVYSRVVAANVQFILDIVIILFVFLLFHMLLHSYKRYFDEVLSGVDKLMEDGGCISLSPELETVECKSNHAKQTLKAWVDEAKKMEQQKNDLMVYLAHDTKTLLTSVIGYLSFLDGDPDMTDDKKVKYVYIAWEKVNRLRMLVNELFEITRSYSEFTTLHKTRIGLYHVLIQISEELYPQLNTYKKHVENDVDENISVYEDFEKLTRVFNNILKNAAPYSEDNSTISVSAEEFPEKTVIRFENRGNIPSSKLNLVFDKSYRLNSARQSDTGGSGLGLAIAKNIITLHGGRIQAENNSGYTALIIEILSTVCKDLGMASQRRGDRIL